MRYKKENQAPSIKKQGELFAEFQVSRGKRPDRSIKRNMVFGRKMILRFSYENMVLLFIAFIMLAVVFFSLGVEKGKRIARQQGLQLSANSASNASQEVRQNNRLDREVQPVAEAYQNSPQETVKSIEVRGLEMPNDILKPYTIQVIAFKKEANAKREMELLKKDGYEAFTIPSQDWFQICVGHYANKKESESDFAALKMKYPTCYIRRTENEEL